MINAAASRRVAIISAASVVGACGRGLSPRSVNPNRPDVRDRTNAATESTVNPSAPSRVAGSRRVTSAPTKPALTITLTANKEPMVSIDRYPWRDRARCSYPPDADGEGGGDAERTTGVHASRWSATASFAADVT